MNKIRLVLTGRKSASKLELRTSSKGMPADKRKKRNLTRKPEKAWYVHTDENGNVLNGGAGKVRLSTRRDPSGERRDFHRMTLTCTQTLYEALEPYQRPTETDRDYLERLSLIALAVLKGEQPDQKLLSKPNQDSELT
jgi:hypothetical protein